MLLQADARVEFDRPGRSYVRDGIDLAQNCLGLPQAPVLASKRGGP